MSKLSKNAEEKRRKLLLELIRARSLLATLNDVAENMMDDKWFQAFQSLEGPSGPLIAFKTLVEEIFGEMGIKRLQIEHLSLSLGHRRSRNQGFQN